jgi:hypothetical protein
MTISTAARTTSHRTLGWVLGSALLLAPAGAAAQSPLLLAPAAAAAQAPQRPADRPAVTAEGERWYREGQAITFRGSFYYATGAEVFFNPYEMDRTGSYRGIPLYSMARDPAVVVYVPVSLGLMQPYERRPERNVSTSSPADRVASLSGTGLQIAGPAYLESPDPHHAYSVRRVALPATMADAGPESPRLPGPLTTALEPTGLNAFYVDYHGRRWFNSGRAVLLVPSAFTRIDDYIGFSTYVGKELSFDTIYIVVADTAPGLLTPYTTRE